MYVYRWKNFKLKKSQLFFFVLLEITWTNEKFQNTF